MPSILFVHENYPAQFGVLARALSRAGWRVVYATAADHIELGKPKRDADGVQIIRYKTHRAPKEDQHPYLRVTERAVLNGQAATRLSIALRNQGFNPDVIVAHSGWGSGSFLKTVWPEAKLIQYLEWWYHYPPIDAPELEIPEHPEDKLASTLCRNLPFMLDAQSADHIIVPTEFQASQVPDLLKHRIQVLHDGIDGTAFSPDRDVQFDFQHDGLPPEAPILTYATRGMEPLRGFPQFMAAASELMQSNPDLHVVVAGQDRVSYGAKLPDGDSHKKRALAAHDFDQSRLHFTGLLPKNRYRDLLRRSLVHVYLTRPFVLSWSMIEAMATGCCLVASDCEAVSEVATHEQSGLLVDMDNHTELVSGVQRCMDDPELRNRLSKNARAAVVPRYDLDRCHAAWLELVTKLSV